MSASDELAKYAAAEASGRDSSCPPDVDAATTLPAERIPTAPVIPCDDPAEEIPEVFLPPNAPPRQPVERNKLPSALIVRNRAASASCATSGKDHYPGTGPTSIAANALQDEFYLDAIDGITIEELYRLSSKVPALQSLIESDLHALADTRDTTPGSLPAAEAAFDASVIALAGVTPTLAEIIREAFYLWLDELDSLAYISVTGALDCAYANEHLWAVCSSVSAVGYSIELVEPDPSEKFVEVTAGFRFARESQSAANSAAAAAAAASLDCVVGNDPQTVQCDASFDTPFTSPFEWDGNFYNTLEELADAGYSAVTIAATAPVPLVFRVTEAADLHFAATKIVANQLAANAALERLNCFYPSLHTVRRCTELSAAVAARAAVLSGGVTAEQILDELITGDYETPRPGPDNVGLLSTTVGDVTTYAADVTVAPKVTLPGGAFIGATESEANSAALVHALQFLNCDWVSPAYSCACLSSDNPSSYLHDSAVVDTLPVIFDSARSVASSTFEPGLLTDSSFPGSLLSDRYPWGSTLDGLCKASLNCLFCNEQIDPTCVVATDKGLLTTVTLWTDGDVVPLTLTPTQYDTLNISTTITGGVKELSVCDNDPANVTAQAVSIAQLPPAIIGGAGDPPACVFTNDRVRVHCNLGAFVLEGSIIPEYLYTGGSPLVDIPLITGSSLIAQAKSLVVLEYRTVYVEIPAGSYESNISKAVATQMAYAFARAALRCEYGYATAGVGPPVRCGATPGMFTPPSLAILPASYGTGALATDPSNPVYPSSTGSLANPLWLGPYTSTIDIDAALRGAYSLALSGLNCFYAANVTAKCDPKPDLREFMSDRRYNGHVWHNGMDTVGGASVLPSGYGQKALFKYSGPVAFSFIDDVYVRTVAPGIVLPSAPGYGSSTTTLADATASATADAQSKLDCTHINWPRNRYRCNRASDILYAFSSIGYGAVESVSTQDANIQAEQIARDLIECEECAPFRLTTWDDGNNTRFQMCPGSATFWSISGSGAGARLKACIPDTDGLTIKRVYWNSCGTPLPTGPTTLASGRYLYWLKITCCPKPGGGSAKEPAIIVIRESSSYTQSAMAAPGFFPDSEYEEKNGDEDALWIYVGGVVAGITDSNDGRRSAVYQHTDENVVVTGGSPGRFIVSYNAALERVYVSKGTVARMVPDVLNEDSPEKVTPGYPELSGVSLDTDPPPYFSAGTGNKEIVWIDDGGAGTIEMRDEEEEEPEEGPDSLVIARIAFGPPVVIDQLWASDIAWAENESESSSSSSESSASSSSDTSSSSGGSSGSSGGSSGDSSDGGSGSDKSTAIVPASWTKGGFTALFTLEAPEVRFEDVFTDLKITDKETRYRIDPRFFEVIHPETLRVVGISGDKPYVVGAVIKDRMLVIHALTDKRRRPDIVQVQISAVRKGFKGMRFPNRSLVQFNANEEFLNSAYPRE